MSFSHLNVWAVARPFAVLWAVLSLSGCGDVLTDVKKELVSQQQSNEKQLTTDEEKLAHLISRYWSFRLEISPMSASYMGRPDILDVDDMSPLAVSERQVYSEMFTNRALEINRENLSDESKLNLDIVRYQIENYASYFKYQQHLMPLTSEYGFHSQLISYLSRQVISDQAKAEQYLAALSKVRLYMAQQTDWLKIGINRGVTQPQEVMQGFEASIEAYITQLPQDHVLYQPLAQLPDSINAEQQQHIQSKAKALIKYEINPAYEQFYDFFVNTYLPSARQTIGVSEIPRGSEFYQDRVHYFTTQPMTVEEVHQLGLSEVARIRAEMQQIIDQLEFEGSFADFLLYLRTDPQFYATTPEQLLNVASRIAKRADAQLPKFFKTLPRRPYGVEPVPEAIAPKYTTGRYVPPHNETDAGYYWVNTYALDKRPLYVLQSLTLHEAVPGHHLQGALSSEQKNLPDFRSHSYISAFGEGWGLYSEYLGLEMGFYRGPYDNFGRLTYEMWRALRLVVDTGIHAKGWTRQQAIDYMAENSALSMHNIQTEVDRYITWPGQALSYKVGELTIKRLRAKAERELGEHFDIREFHDEVLRHGSIPLNALETQIDAFIQHHMPRPKNT
ncbi:DUF885 domain-containing protein [Echinimonas agarilytica]|uniref:DUF885 domain-containing protein n=1 Tax=Echinimonas agarilytica TaxID=1215918 RepID=A0AA42B7C1_9GAMM|nr:DUF885 domain-containing protein [Echinimonas agarilytica]MCM2679735.1 DUF885 domain-containing protein [Echinimonas agarilytica]